MKTASQNPLKSFLFFAFLAIVSCKKSHVNQPPVANAGASQTITSVKPNITLTGSGTDADGTVVSYLWSVVSGPGVPNIASPSQATTTASSFAQGTYIFQLMVTDNNGATGVDTMMVKVNPPEIDTVNLQPSNNPTEMHIWGNSTGLEQSSSGSPEIGAASWTSGASQVGMRAAIQFDLSGIPANAIINSAKLILYSDHTPLNGNQADANYGADNSMYIQQITASWNPANVTWTNQPQSTSTGQVSVPSTTSSFLDLSLDVTSMVGAMVNNNENFGFLIKLQNETPYTSRIFCSSRYSDATRHPKLVVAYTKIE